jgi:putative membrane protein
MPLQYPAGGARYRVGMVGILALVFAALAALLHVYIFIMESVRWTTPAVWRRFGVADQQAADIVRPMAYNQGFYNLFLAIGAGLGILLFAMGSPDSEVAGRTLILFSLGSMVGAALVLTTTGLKYLRAALLQGTLPLIGFVLTLFA